MNKIINWMGGWPKDGLVSGSDWEERLAVAAERSRRQENAEPRRLDDNDVLKETLAQSLLKGKTGGSPDRFRLTAGADAALTRLAERSVSSGDAVLAEKVTSRSALQIFRKAGIRVEPVDGDEQGLHPEAVDAAIALHKPKLVYVAPVCSDPEGIVWTAERLAEVSSVCRHHGVTLLRDDRQEMLLYEQESYRDIAAIPTADGVISIGQLPPGLIAGLRFGWAAGEPELLERWLPASSIAGAKQQAAVTALERQALSDLLAEQPLEPLLEMFRVQCGERMRRLTDILKKRLVRDMGWRAPAGGVHLWLKLPEGLDGETLLRGAWIKGLMFQPGAPFYTTQPQRNTLRLTFAYADERQMKLGVSRLVDAMGDFLGRFDIG